MMGLRTDTGLLELDDAVRASSGVERLAVLASAAGVGEVDGAPLGAAHAALLGLLLELTGPRLDAAVSCPGCGELLSCSLALPDVLAAAEDAPPSGPLELDGWWVEWLPVTVGLLREVAAAGDPDTAERALLAGVVERAKAPDGSSATVADLPVDVRAALPRAIAASDPLVEVVVDLTCVACSTQVAAEVDVVEHTSTAVAAAARRLLDDVHTLALAYGWTEAEVLAVPRRRRGAYLEAVRSGQP